MEAYLDNSATTPVCQEAISAMQYALETAWGNPSSLHSKGLEAEQLLQKAREQVSQRLHCLPEELYFTSGGTESNNLALIGAARALRRYGRRIITTNVEHPSVDESVSQLEQDGFEVLRLPVDRWGRVSEQDISRAIDKNTILVSVMSVNNETGTIQPVETLRRIIHTRRSPALLHCDAVQSFGKLDLRPATLGVDLMSVSAHKIHGPKGVGALYVKKGVHIAPRTFGGAQETAMRPGTQPLPAIAGFGAAAACLPDAQQELAHMQSLREHMLSGLGNLGGIQINSPQNALPYVTNFSVLGKNGNNMLHFLSERGVYISTGSACSKGRASRVLRAMGLSREALDGALRVSFSRFTTMQEVDHLLYAIAEGKTALRSR